jgi:hypothetical protein
MLQEFCFTMVNVEFALKLHPRYGNGPRAEHRAGLEHRQAWGGLNRRLPSEDPPGLAVDKFGGAGAASF